MFADIFAGMDVTQLAVLIVSAILIGINKTAIPGIGVLPGHHADDGVAKAGSRPGCS